MARTDNVLCDSAQARAQKENYQEKERLKLSCQVIYKFANRA